MERSDGRGRRRLVAACLAAAALHLAVGVFDHEIWSPTEPAVAGVVWNMADRGLLAVPHIGDYPYLEKPPGLYWLGWLGVEASGQLRPGWLRLPSALLLLGAGLVLAWVVRRRHGDDAAAATLLLFSTTLPVLLLAHRASPDGPALAFATLAFALYLDSLGEDGRSGVARDALLALVLALSFYAKNLFVAFVVVPPIGLDLVLRRRFARAARLAGLTAAFGVVVLGPWILALAHAGGAEDVRVVLVDNTVGRFLRVAPALRPAVGPLNDAWTAERDGPLWVYVAYLPAVIAPWTLLWLGSLPLLWRARDPWRSFLRRTLWLVPLVLTVSSSRNVDYLAPLAPVEVLCGVELLACGLPGVWPRRLAAANAALVALAVLALPFVLIAVLGGGGGLALGVWGVLGVGAALVGGWRARASLLATPVLVIGLVGVTLSLVGSGRLALPRIDARNSTAAFFASVAPQLEGRQVFTTVLDDRRYPLLTWYLRRAVPVVRGRKGALAELARPEPTAVFVAADGYARAVAQWQTVPHRALVPVEGKRVFLLLLNEPHG